VPDPEALIVGLSPEKVSGWSQGAQALAGMTIFSAALDQMD
jgi:hypothetical protein